MKLTTLTNDELVQLYRDKHKYKNLEMPPIIGGLYKVIMDRVTFELLESELKRRNCEIPSLED